MSTRFFRSRWAALAALMTVLLVPSLALADESTNPTDLGALIPEVLTAIHDHAWTLVAALVVGFLVALGKTGWAGKWIDAKLSPRVTPWVAAVFTFLGAVSADIIAGQSLQSAIQAAALVAFLPMIGHQLGIESLRNGKEIIPQKPTDNVPPAVKRDAPTTPALGHIDTDPPPPPPRAA